MCIVRHFSLTQRQNYCKIYLQGDQPTDCGSPRISEGGEKLFIAPGLKGGGRMITYSDFYQLIVAICEVITVYMLIKNAKKK